MAQDRKGGSREPKAILHRVYHSQHFEREVTSANGQLVTISGSSLTSSLEFKLYERLRMQLFTSL
jgi:hypothetical protein